MNKWLWRAWNFKGLWRAFYGNPDRMNWIQPHPSHTITSKDKALNDDYFCWKASNKQKFTWKEVKRQPENLENGQLLSGWGFVQSENATAASSWINMDQ